MLFQSLTHSHYPIGYTINLHFTIKYNRIKFPSKLAITLDVLLNWKMSCMNGTVLGALSQYIISLSYSPCRLEKINEESYSCTQAEQYLSDPAQSADLPFMDNTF